MTSGAPSAALEAEQDARAQPTNLGRQIRVLILSASMGGGHDGAARALAGRLEHLGHEAEVLDFLDSGPFRIGTAMKRGYELELKHAPSAYDAVYRFWYRAPWLCPGVAWLVCLLTRRWVSKQIRRVGADVVVSTYPLSTLCLGELRRTARLDVPAVNFITDFGVHPLWVHPGIDLNLAVHEVPAARALAASGRPAIACGPAISPRFDPSQLPQRAAARATLGLRPDQRAVLVVAGSWGVGNLDDTWTALAADGRFTPVFVCGNDARLFARVRTMAANALLPSIVLGWTEEMPALMSACDAVVENAGGLTSLEAMRAGLPVVSFDPIAGHGRENTTAMDAAGVGRLARDRNDLLTALDVLTRPGPAREQQIRRAHNMFRSDPAEAVVDAVAPPLPATGVEAPLDESASA